MIRNPISGTLLFNFLLLLFVCLLKQLKSFGVRKKIRDGYFVELKFFGILLAWSCFQSCPDWPWLIFSSVYIYIYNIITTFTYCCWVLNLISNECRELYCRCCLKNIYSWIQLWVLWAYSYHKQKQQKIRDKNIIKVSRKAHHYTLVPVINEWDLIKLDFLVIYLFISWKSKVNL